MAWLKVASQDHDAGIWVLAATTGMRRSELAGLRREFLDLGNANLLIEPTRVVVAGKAEDSDGKTDSSQRRISLDPFTVQALRSHLQCLDHEAEAFGPAYDGRGFLLSHPDGRPLHPDTITRRFNRLVDRASVSRIHLHDVRHTYVTASIDAGINPKQISDRVGHSTLAFTLGAYAHRTTNSDADAALAFAELIFGENRQGLQ